MEHVLWVDPGLSTGTCLLDLEKLTVTQREMPFYEACGYIDELLCLYGDKVGIGWETFTITTETAKKSPQPEALMVIGVCDYLTSVTDAVRLKPAGPGDRFLGKKEWLKELGWLPKGMKDDDALSATQHMLAYLIRSHSLPAELAAKLFTEGSVTG
jgi:hypothetical protein